MLWPQQRPCTNLRVYFPGIVPVVVSFSRNVHQLFFQFGELLPNRLPEKTQSSLGNYPFLVFPLAIIDQVILEASETHAVPAENIAGFEALAQLPVDEKFISIGQHASVPPRVFQIKVTFELVRNASGGNDRFSIMSSGLPFGNAAFRKWTASISGSSVEGAANSTLLQNGAEVSFEPRRDVRRAPLPHRLQGR